MTRHRVSSSSIRSVGYDPENQILEIELRRGGVYQYFQVPPEAHQALIGASSIGRFYTKFIKPEYRFRKVN
ncbi:MAG: KTSC domain-containing protein [Pyrinomonadaceae bacterium]